MWYTDNRDFGGQEDEIFIRKRDSGALEYLRAQRPQLLRGRSRPRRFSDGQDLEIPKNAEKPERSNKSKPAPQTLADILKEEKRSRIHGGIYHKVQVELTYNSNHMEGSRLTHEQTRFILKQTPSASPRKACGWTISSKPPITSAVLMRSSKAQNRSSARNLSNICILT